MSKPFRTRFAPSPTGYLHVGGIRTALFAYLLAKQHGGQFVLRFEDTDKKREVEGARQHLIDSLTALGLEYDEGPNTGGPFAPYIQSERLDNYQKWAQQLVDAGRAYADPYTPEEVQAFREQAQKEKRPFLYRNHRPENPPAWDGTRPLRFKSDPKPYTRHDEVMGDLSTVAEVIDDFVLMKSDGYPTYNFAHIVDDAEMEITHIIRGQEFLASVPNYLNLYEALELEAPKIATVPHILGPDGNKKLSKRDGAKDVLDYIDDGILPEALISFIATLGWNDGTTQEVYTRDNLLDKFSLDRVQKSGARFDERRLLWMNGYYIREIMPLEELYDYVAGSNFLDKTYWEMVTANYDKQYLMDVLGVVRDRLKYLDELPELTEFFFAEDIPVNLELIDTNKQLKKFTHDELKQMLTAAQGSLAQSDFSIDDLTTRLNQLLEDTGQKPGVLFSLIRIATTQAPASPGLAETMHILGKEISLKRIKQQMNAL